MLTVALTMGVVVAAMQAVIWPLALWGASRLLGAQGNVRGARLAAAWSSLPVLLSYGLAPLGADSASALGAFYGTLSFFLTGWTLYLLVQSLAAAQTFSSGKAVGSVLIGGLLFVLALFFVCVMAAVVLLLFGVAPEQMPKLR